MQSDIVLSGYERIASAYLAERDQLKSGKYVQKLLKLLPKSATILDVGCGAGVPVDEMLLKAGHTVLGIDISPTMIKLARQRCPGGEYEVKDIMSLREKEYEVEAVVSFYALFHLPRERQEERLRVLMSFVRPKGYMLITMGEREFEGEHMMYGEKMWSSQWGAEKNREIMKRLGYKILIDEIDRSGGEAHQIFLGQKIA